MAYQIVDAENVDFHASIDENLSVDFGEDPFQKSSLIIFSLKRILKKNDESRETSELVDDFSSQLFFVEKK